jgi:hypothetical protein
MQPSPFPHLPSAAHCQANMTLAEAGRKATLAQARQLGYFAWVQGDNPFGWREVWIGGGADGLRLRDMLEDAALRVRVWQLALTMQEDSGQWAEAAERELRGMVGARRFVTGELVNPLP